MEENLKQQHTEVIKIAMYGPESTGKTTLASQLADEFNTIWIPEFARDYLQEKWNSKQEICSQEDLIPIAIGQTQLENNALNKANKILFCDTNLLVTKVFSDIYYNNCDAILEKAAKKHKYDLIFADPPYDLPNIPEIIHWVKENSILNDGGILIIEHASLQNLSSYPGFIEARKYGTSTFSFFE